MAMSESSALSRVLCISKELYSAAARGEQQNYREMLDSLSAALSHFENEDKPLAKCMGALKRELRHESREFYRRIKKYFSVLRYVPEIDKDNAARHIPALIYGNDKICEQLDRGDAARARAMADAMKSYPGYLFGEYEALSGEQFYELVFGFYPKLYDEPFMDEVRYLFCQREDGRA
ncbi:MAG: hypothetical protein ACI4KA_05495 [Oscillospiraceae bacterium]